MKEMEALKKQFPEYKNIPDSVLLTLVAKKYPEYRKLDEKFKKDEKYNASFRKALKDTVGEALTKTKQSMTPMGIVNPAFNQVSLKAQADIISKDVAAIDAPMGAVRGLASAKGTRAGDSMFTAAIHSAVQGLKQPDAQQTVGESFQQAYGSQLKTLATILLAANTKTKAAKQTAAFLGIDEPVVEGLIAGTIGTIAELGTLDLTYRVLPEALISKAKNFMKQVKIMKFKAKGTELLKLRDDIAQGFLFHYKDADAKIMANRVMDDLIKSKHITEMSMKDIKATRAGIAAAEDKFTFVMAQLRKQQPRITLANEASYHGGFESSLKFQELLDTGKVQVVTTEGTGVKSPMFRDQVSGHIYTTGDEYAMARMKNTQERSVIRMSPNLSDVRLLPSHESVPVNIANVARHYKTYNAFLNNPVIKREAKRYFNKPISELTKLEKAKLKYFYTASHSPDTTMLMPGRSIVQLAADLSKPREVYHGTHMKYKSFDKKFLGSATKASSAKEGFFFATNRVVAESYADEAIGIKTGGKLVEAKAKLVKVTGERYSTVMTKYAKGHKYTKAVTRLINQIQKYEASIERASDTYNAKSKLTGKVKAVTLDMKNPSVFNADERPIKDIGVTKIIKDAKEKGHDSVIIKNTYDSATSAGDELTDVHVVFNEGQIKQSKSTQQESDQAHPKTPEQLETEAIKELSTEQLPDEIDPGIETPKDKTQRTKAAHKFLDQRGFVNTGDVYNKIVDTVIDAGGDLEQSRDKLSQAAMRFSIPYWLGEKYPAFKPIYKAIEDANAESIGIFADMMDLLDVKFHKSLLPKDSAKVVDILRYGDSIHQEFTAEQLVTNFSLTENQVQSYMKFRKFYDECYTRYVENKKISYKYDEMNEETRLKFDKHVQENLQRHTGYMNQQRIGGNWYVVKTGERDGKEVVTYFRLFHKKSEAEKIAKTMETVARKRTEKPIAYNSMSTADLEALINASGVDNRSDTVKALREELAKRGFASHWIARKEHHPGGYVWKLDNILESATDYIEGVLATRKRIVGNQSAVIALKDNIKKMDSNLAIYARDYITAYYNTGAIGYRAASKFIYSWHLAGNVSWLAMNLTQPFTTTLPYLIREVGVLKATEAMAKAYKSTVLYGMHKLGKGSHELSGDVFNLLEELHKEGRLGDQLTKFQLGIEGMTESDFSQFIGLFGRFGEFTNRTMTALSAIDIAKTKLGLTDMQMIKDYAMRVVNSTQFAYGKHNIPLSILAAGDTKHLLKLMYIFRSYQHNYLQYLADMNRHSKKAFATGIGALLAQAGIVGLPFYQLINYAYKKAFGYDFEYAARDAGAKHHMSKNMLNIILRGGLATVGVDGSRLIGMGAIVPTFGDLATNIFGASFGTARNLFRGTVLLAQGDRRAYEYLTPTAIKGLIKARRYALEGIRSFDNKLLAIPSKLDIALTALNLAPMTETAARLKIQFKHDAIQLHKDEISRLHKNLAWAIYKKDKEEQRRIIEIFKSHGYHYSADTIRRNIKKIHGIDALTPKRLRSIFHNINTILK